MERKSLWKNFLLLTVGSLLVFHIDGVSAADSTESTDTSSDASDECVLEE
jgi:hypothetical protein